MSTKPDAPFSPLNIAVLTVSDTRTLESDKQVEGFGELFRQVSVEDIGTSTIQSRALAGLANRTLVACMPGSTNACRTAWTRILEPQLDSRTRPCNFVQHLGSAEQCGRRA